jgi:hypothetical protein
MSKSVVNQVKGEAAANALVWLLVVGGKLHHFFFPENLAM